MNFLSKSAWSVAAATVTLATVVGAAPQAANAFGIRTTLGASTYPSVPNPSLPAPTLIPFNNNGGNPANSLASVVLPGSGDPNGSASITTTGTVDVNGGVLIVGGGTNTGTATFSFGATPGLGYFGFQWLTPQTGSSVVFTSSTGATQSFTASALGLTGSSFVEFFVVNPTEIIKSVQFIDSNSASGVAFQIDNVNYQAIPTPAMLPGLIAMGLGVLRKRKGETEAEA